MALIDIVYKSLLLFSSIFIGVLIISYVSYKIKNKGKALNPHLQTELEDNMPGQLFQAQKQFMTTSIYSESGIIPSETYHKNHITSPQYEPANTNINEQKKLRYTKVDVLHHPSSKKHTSRKPSSTYYIQKDNISNLYSDKTKYGSYCLSSANILNYYDDNNDNEFYLFRTKY